MARRGHPYAHSVSWAGTLPRVAGNMDSSTQNKERMPDGPGERGEQRRGQQWQNGVASLLGGLDFLPAQESRVGFQGRAGQSG